MREPSRPSLTGRGRSRARAKVRPWDQLLAPSAGGHLGPGPGARSPSGVGPPTPVREHVPQGPGDPPPHEAGWTLSSGPTAAARRCCPGRPGAVVRGQPPAGRPGKHGQESPVPGETAGPLVARMGSVEPGLWPSGAPSLCSPGAQWPGPGAPRRLVACCLGWTAFCVLSRSHYQLRLKEGALVELVTPHVGPLCCAKMARTPGCSKWRPRVSSCAPARSCHVTCGRLRTPGPPTPRGTRRAGGRWSQASAGGVAAAFVSISGLLAGAAGAHTPCRPGRAP